MDPAEQLILGITLIVGALAGYKLINWLLQAVYNGTPEQREADRRQQEERHWCEYKGDVCRDINKYQKPWKQCMRYCEHYKRTWNDTSKWEFYED